VIAAAKKYGAAIAGLPAVDTVKQVERTAEGAIVKATIPRASVVLAQTPQGFQSVSYTHLDVYKRQPRYRNIGRSHRRQSAPLAGPYSPASV